MMERQVLDDGGRLEDRRLAVQQHRELALGMHGLHEGLVLGMLGPHLAELERDALGIERDQRLPAVGGKAMTIECKRHQRPASIFARRSLSGSLGSGAPKSPVFNGPAGS